MSKVRVKDVRIVGERRATNFDRVAELADSIAEVGLLNPITVTQDMGLVAGLHRLEAHEMLGLVEIEANILTLNELDAELAQIDENLVRNELGTYERGPLLIRRKEIYEAKYPETKHGGDRKSKRRNVVLMHDAFTEDAAKKTGKSKRTIEREIQIATAFTGEQLKALADADVPKTKALKLARKEPEDRQAVVDRIASGEAKTVEAAERLIRMVTRREAARALPEKIYSVVYADPPWKYQNTGVHGAAQHHYETMTNDDICRLPETIKLSVANNAVLFMWVTSPLLDVAFDVVKAWGFEYKTHMVWVKTYLVKPGSGFYVRGRHELLFICTRGSFLPLEDVSPPIGSVVSAPVREHSRKPDEFYHIIEKLYPGCNRIELFARNHHAGWDAWGDEADAHD